MSYCTKSKENFYINYLVNPQKCYAMEIMDTKLHVRKQTW